MQPHPHTLGFARRRTALRLAPQALRRHWRAVVELAAAVAADCAGEAGDPAAAQRLAEFGHLAARLAEHPFPPPSYAHTADVAAAVRHLGLAFVNAAPQRRALIAPALAATARAAEHFLDLARDAAAAAGRRVMGEAEED